MRLLPVLFTSVALAIAAAAPAQAFTPPIGTDKGSVTERQPPVPVPPVPAPSGIIAILIG